MSLSDSDEPGALRNEIHGNVIAAYRTESDVAVSAALASGAAAAASELDGAAAALSVLDGADSLVVLPEDDVADEDSLVDFC
jgi:hypothetical protein